MHFPREALRGIFDALSSHDKDVIRLRVQELGGYTVPWDSPKRVEIVQQAMIELGYLMPFDVRATDAGAEEYDAIMKAQELMHGS